VQRQLEAERLDMEKQFVHIGAHMDERVRVLETRVAACEGRVEARDSYVDDPHSQAAANAAMTRAVVQNSLSEVDAQWRMEHEELRIEQQQQLHQLEDLASEVGHVASRVQQAEAIMGGFERTLRRSEEEVQGLLTRHTQRPPWFGQLEGAIAALERRLGEQQVAAEVQLGRVRVDVDGLLRRTEGIQGLRDELFREVEECLRQEFERRLDLHRNDSQLRSGGHLAPDVSAWGGNGARDLTRRLDDSEARVAALKVRVDAHDSRFGSLGERTEALCQQANESARQAATRLREEILSEADCQLDIVRNRIEQLSELF